MKILALSSSPRSKGNTELLLDSLLGGIKDVWAELPGASNNTIELIRLAELHISPCIQCDYCLKHGRCSINDDMQLLYPKVTEADGLVLASPIYFMAHCAQAKLFIDRCQVFWARKYVLRQAPPSATSRRGVFLAVGATRGKQVFAGAKVTMKWLFDALAMEYWDNLLFEGIDAKGVIREHPEALHLGYELGRKLAEEEL